MMITNYTVKRLTAAKLLYTLWNSTRLVQIAWKQVNNLANNHHHTRFCTAPRYLSPLDRVADLPGRRALCSASFSFCRRLGCPMSVARASTSLLLVFGMGCPKTLPRRRRYQHSGVVWKLTFSNSHVRMLLYIRHPSGPCDDTGHLGHYKNNWTELIIIVLAIKQQFTLCSHANDLQ